MGKGTVKGTSYLYVVRETSYRRNINGDSPTNYLSSNTGPWRHHWTTSRLRWNRVYKDGDVFQKFF